MPDDSLLIGDRAVGAGHRPFIIAEIAQAHDGSLGIAHSFIDAIAEAGADAVKFQTHIAAAESTAREPWRVRFSRQDATRQDYWRRMEFTPEQWRGLKEHAEERGLIFLSSPFSPEAFELLRDLGMKAWKVASGEVTNEPLLGSMAGTGLPVLLSSGMSSIGELDRAVALCRERGAGVGVMQCTTKYPCPPEQVGLNILEAFRDRYGCAVGLSDHSGKIFAGLAAIALGASMVEVHVTFSRQMFGPDGPASLTFPELAQLTQGAMEIHRMRQSPVDKSAIFAEMKPLRDIFQKTVVARRDLKAGEMLREDSIALKKAGGEGLRPDEAFGLVGRRLVRDLPRDTPVTHADLGQQN